MQVALGLEKSVNQSLLDLHEVAASHKDAQVCITPSWSRRRRYRRHRHIIITIIVMVISIVAEILTDASVFVVRMILGPMITRTAKSVNCVISIATVFIVIIPQS